MPELAFETDGSALAYAPNRPEESQQEHPGWRPDWGPFDANLLSFLEESSAQSIAHDLCDAIESDYNSGMEGREAFARGLRALGLHDESGEADEARFPGASVVRDTHILEAMLATGAKLVPQLMPPDGPAKGVPINDQAEQAHESAEKLAEALNHKLMYEWDEWADEHEKCLHYSPTLGSGFKKVFFDPRRGRVTSCYISPADLIVPYTATDLQTAERVTHIYRRTPREVRWAQNIGWFADVDLPEPSSHTAGAVGNNEDPVKTTADRIAGRSDDASTHRESQASHLLYECHCYLDDIESDMPLPYVAVLDGESRKILSLRRNWREDDPLFFKRQAFVHYGAWPGVGFYRLGFVHVLGQISDATTAGLRQTLDAAVLSMFPAWLKNKTTELKPGDTLLPYGYFLDVDASPEELQNGIREFRAPPPQAVMLDLINELTSRARRLVSTQDISLEDGAKDTPVGTTLAMLESQNRIFTGLHSRYHRAQARELKLILQLCLEAGEIDESLVDYNGDQVVDVHPVSDPAIYSRTQRLVLAQAKRQMAMEAPERYDMREVDRQFLEAHDVPEDDINAIMKPDQEQEPPPKMDPYSERVRMLAGEPVMAYGGQPHVEHVMDHYKLLGDLETQPEIHQQIQPMALNHIAEHQSLWEAERIERAREFPAMAVEIMSQEFPFTRPGVEDQRDAQREQQELELAKQRAEVEKMYADMRSSMQKLYGDMLKTRSEIVENYAQAAKNEAEAGKTWTESAATEVESSIELANALDPLDQPTAAPNRSNGGDGDEAGQ